jgi:hypothetical protein
MRDFSVVAGVNVGFHPCALRLERGCFGWRCDVDAGDIVGCVLLGGIGSRSVTFSREEFAFLVEITSVDGWLVPSSFVDGWIVRVSLGAVDDWIVRISFRSVDEGIVRTRVVDDWIVRISFRSVDEGIVRTRVAGGWLVRICFGSVDEWVVPSSFLDGWIFRISVGSAGVWVVRTGVGANDGHGADADHNDDGCFAL